MKRVLQIALSLYLVMGLGGLTPMALADIFQTTADCCADCEPDCPDEKGDACPPQCTDCRCPGYASVMLQAASESLLAVLGTEEPRATSAQIRHEPPMVPGIFRPPRHRA